MKNFKPILLLVLFCFTSMKLFSQNLPFKNIKTDKNGQISYAELHFNQDINIPDHRSLLNLLLKTKNKDSFQFKKAKKDKYGIIHTRYQQYYENLKVEGAEYIVHEKLNEHYKFNGNYIQLEGINTAPNITKTKALDFALNEVNANLYKWESKEMEEFIKIKNNDISATYFPEGDLLLTEISKSGEWRLVWKFNISAIDPFLSESVYVDAINGNVIKRISLMRDINSVGSAQTKYSGTRTLISDSFTGGFRLREERNGINIQTLNLQEGTLLANAVDFVDNDNSWTSAEHDNTDEDLIALDVHWGIEQIVDYFTQVHSRNSIDDAGMDVLSYVHYSTGWDNARWDSDDQVMLFGDGNTYDPLVSIDICAHEFAHGVDQHEAALEYEYESGAINEGLSDIWGAAIEFWAAPEKDHWQIGEEIGGLRSLSNPNAFQQPDTYEGTYWFDHTSCSSPDDDFCGVHTNSGVINHWFYLLTDGGSGTNDNNNSYSVTGIGIASAAEIVYQGYQYLTSTSDYLNARDAMINAAEDIFCNNSPEIRAVTNAWHAVGVGNSYIDPYMEVAGPSLICVTGNDPFTVSNLASGTTLISWSVSPASAFDTDSGTGNSFTSNADNSLTSSSGSVYATVSGLQGCETIISKNIWIGDPAKPGTIDIAMDVPPRRFTATIADIESATSYKWYIDGVYNQTTSTGTAIFNRTATCDDYYFLEVQAENRCDIGVKNYKDVYGPSCDSSDPFMLVSPSPASKETTVDIVDSEDHSEKSSSWAIKVFDENQILVFEKSNITSKRLQVNTRNFKNGLYFIHAYYKGELLTNKLLVNN
ncbi:MAG: M4 family metallopeptidase [Candidatus Cyclobacteriaceae bacterium M2_1C_046]